MKKPREPRPVKTQEAPRANPPRSPFERNRKSSPPVQRQEGREPGRKVYSGPPKADRTGSKSPARRPDHSPVRNPERRPGALVNRRAADRLRNGYLWVYASDIESIEVPGTGSDDPPALLPVADSRGLLLGTALYSPSSQIALRMVSREAIDEAGCGVPFSGGNLCSTARPTPADSVSAKPMSCRAWWRISTATS